ncbi:3931_t:CDS:2, partial [Ambispora gerdemannii]
MHFELLKGAYKAFIEAIETGISHKKLKSATFDYIYEQGYTEKDLFQTLNNLYPNLNPIYFALFGFCYEQGIGTQRNINISFQIYLQGAMKEDATSVHWCRLAADKGLALAQDKFALSASRGKGMKRDLHEAI